MRDCPRYLIASAVIARVHFPGDGKSSVTGKNRRFCHFVKIGNPFSLITLASLRSLVFAAGMAVILSFFPLY